MISSATKVPGAADPASYMLPVLLEYNLVLILLLTITYANLVSLHFSPKN